MLFQLIFIKNLALLKAWDKEISPRYSSLKIQVFKVKCKENGNIYAAKIANKHSGDKSSSKMAIQERNNLLCLKDNANLCEF